MNRRRAALLIVMVSIVVGIRVAALGVPRIGGDTSRYTEGAAHLLAGERLVGKESSYLAYVAFVAATSLLFGDSLVFVIVLQVVVVVIATAIVYRMAREIRDETAGIAAAALFCVNADVALWTSYVLTDALYLSFVAFATWSMYRRSRGWPLIVLVTVLLRPTGWLFVPLVLFWCAARLQERFPARKLMIASAVVACLLGALAIAALSSHLRNAIDEVGADDALRQGVVVWGWPGWNMAMPADATPSRGWTSAIPYLWKHPVASARLAITRVAVEIRHTRSNYPPDRNLMILLYYAPLYLLALIGWWTTSAHPLSRMGRDVIVAHLLLVAATFADWDGRWIVHVIPILCVYAGCTLAGVLAYARPQLLRIPYKYRTLTLRQ